MTDSLTGYAEPSYGKVEALNHQWQASQNTRNTCIRPDNAYSGQRYRACATPSWRETATAFSTKFFRRFLHFPGSCLRGTIVTKDWSDQNDQTVTTDTEVTRAVFG